MLSSKYLALLFVVGIAHALEEDLARQNPPAAPAAPADPAIPTLPPQTHWTEQIRQAVNGANERFSNNLVVVLSGLSETMRNAGYNNTRAFAQLTRAIVSSSVDLSGIVAYMPRLLLLDLPNQFTEVLRLIRRNEVRVPSSVNEAIDSILVLTRQAEESGITNRVFGPVVRVMPNILNGVHDYLQTIFTTSFNVFGANLPDPSLSPIPVPQVPGRSEDESNATTASPSSSVAPEQASARYLY